MICSLYFINLAPLSSIAKVFLFFFYSIYSPFMIDLCCSSSIPFFSDWCISRLFCRTFCGRVQNVVFKWMISTSFIYAISYTSEFARHLVMPCDLHILLVSRRTTVLCRVRKRYEELRKGLCFLNPRDKVRQFSRKTTMRRQWQFWMPLLTTGSLMALKLFL